MLAVLCYVLVVLSTLVDSATLIVDTPLGKIRGLEVTANNSKTYWSFRGIPYAKPPLGKLRFAKPVALTYQDKIIDGTAPGKSCIQPPMILSKDVTSEDCLILNVYTKYVDLNNPKKVLVWIHGGAFLLGSSSIDAGTFVTDHDVIVVTLNYRLGLLGFFSTEDDASPGNYGLWDQAMALKWVKYNIGAFGGDPDDITISGESAGGESVSLLSLSPVTKGLFTKAYSQSGAATTSFAKYGNSRSVALEIAKSFHCSDGHEIKGNTTSSKLIIDCLRTIPAGAFVQINLFEEFRPKMKPRADGEFLPRTPLSLLKDTFYLEKIGFYNRTYVVGLNNNEKTTVQPFHYGTLQAIFENVTLNDSQKEKLWQDYQKKTYTTIISDGLDLETLPNHIFQTVVDWYEDRNTIYTAIPEIVTDLQFYIPTFQVLNAIARSKTTDAWLLYFNYYPHYMRGDSRGMVHVLDLTYWFDTPADELQKMLSSKTPTNFDARDKRVKARLAAIIASFVKFGNPSLALRDIIPTGWPTYDLLDAQYLDFNENPTVQTHLMREQRELWEKTVASLVARSQHGTPNHSDPCS
ncbi:pyrethroid hydrolase Ces2a-like [Physella acuta]|uniref:pyrethroid hydrolase Ces2a-like n=1 Tax=Physella acuta TaxID=109671 RepID=UPI0027DAD70F|nr:pyrethroid hydrolase Ces2a-like [Physella acuta]XP_059158606.1 pyrethroid hydrolase Ces2a-like [Physella acuta]